MKKLTKKKRNEMQIARGRLKGALQVIVNPSDEEESGNESAEKKISGSSSAHGRTRGRPPKKTAKSDTPPPAVPAPQPAAEPLQSNAVHESFVMKLFDRSLDLAKYDEHTPLYPICRAWLMNQPRSNSIKSFKNRRSPSPKIREKNDKLLQKVLDGTVADIHSLPAPKPMEIPRVPSPLPEQKESSKLNIKLDYDINSPLNSKEDLLDKHKKRWLKVRNKWNAHIKACQQRYVVSYEILEAIYKPSQ